MTDEERDEVLAILQEFQPDGTYCHDCGDAMAYDLACEVWILRKRLATFAADTITREDTISVDLKWSLWTPTEDGWGEHAPGTWNAMRAAFLGETGPLTVHTSPRKEIRFGEVRISKGEARVTFWCEYDDDVELEDPFITRTAIARDFPALMRGIAAVEADLIKDEEDDNDRTRENSEEQALSYSNRYIAGDR